MERLRAVRVGKDTDWKQFALDLPALEPEQEYDQARVGRQKKKFRPPSVVMNDEVQSLARKAAQDADLQDSIRRSLTPAPGSPEQLCFKYRPRCSDELVLKFEPYICKMIYSMTTLFKYNSSDNCMEVEDLKQLGRMMVVEAYNRFEEGRGMQLSSFVILYVKSKFINLGEKIQNANKRGTLNFTAFMSDYDDEEDFSAADRIAATSNPEDAYISGLDQAELMAELSPDQQQIYIARYLEGLTMKEIKKKKAKDLSLKQIKASLKTLSQIHEEHARS